MENKKRIRKKSIGEAELLDLLPKMAIFPGEDKATFEDLRQALLSDLSPATPYETTIAEKIITLEWESHRHRSLRDALIMKKFKQLVERIFSTKKITSEYENDRDRALSEYSLALISSNEKNKAIATEKLKELGYTPEEVLSEAYAQVLNLTWAHEEKLAELELRQRRLYDDLNIVKRTRPDSIEDADILSEP